MKAIELTRQAYTIPGAAAGIIGDTGIGYLRVRSFDAPDCLSAVWKSLAAFTEAGARGLILDLRGNSGGLVTNGTAILQLFVKAGELSHEIARREGRLVETRLLTEGNKLQIVQRRGRDKATLTEVARTIPQIWTKKVVILVNEKTASTAERVAGTLRDLLGATLVGRRTFGKGVGQIRHQLSNGCGLEVTSFRFYLPSGFFLGCGYTEPVGLAPDVTVSANTDEAYLQAAKGLFEPA